MSVLSWFRALARYSFGFELFLIIRRPWKNIRSEKVENDNLIGFKAQSCYLYEFSPGIVMVLCPVNLVCSFLLYVYHFYKIRMFVCCFLVNSRTSASYFCRLKFMLFYYFLKSLIYFSWTQKSSC